MRVTVNNDNNNLNRSSSNHQTYNQSYQQSSHINNNLPSNSYSENNFYCSICDQYCSQKQLTYIIIKIPSCVSCSTKKIAIIDDDHLKNSEHDYFVNDKIIPKNVISCNNFTEKIKLRHSALPDNLSSTSNCHYNKTTLNALEDENITKKNNNEIENLITAENKTLKFNKSINVKSNELPKKTMETK